MARLNIVVGVVGVALFMILGFVLQMNIEAEKGFLEGAMKELWMAAHVHGNALAILNVLAGVLIIGGKLSGKVVKTASVLVAIGGILIPVALFLGGFNPSLVNVLAPIGTISMIVGWLLFSGVVVAGKARF